MPELLTTVDVKTAKPGDAVQIATPEFDVVNDGAGLRVFEAVANHKVYSREAILARKAQLEAELANVEIVLTKMDELGVL